MDVQTPCLCPGTPHEADTITLRDVLPFREALTARNTIVLAKAEDPNATNAEIAALLTETFLYAGVASWTVTDAKGKPVPVNKATITEYLLSQPDVAIDVGETADTLYAEKVVSPLVMRAQQSLPISQTNGSTSAMNGSSPKHRTRSKRSSTTTSLMDATEQM